MVESCRVVVVRKQASGNPGYMQSGDERGRGVEVELYKSGVGVTGPAGP